MSIDSQAITNYIKHVKDANNESAKKHHLHNLLIRLFDKDTSAREIIDRISSGSELLVYDIPTKKKGIGFQDTQYDRVIIEFENNLKVTGVHAKEQLEEYLSGNWRSGNEYPFTLISTDCLEWQIYAPRYDILTKPQANNLYPIEIVDSINFENVTPEDIYFFLDKYLFKYEPKVPTLSNIKSDFGETSNLFLSVFPTILTHYRTVKNDPHVKTSYEQWQKFLSVAYGTFDATEEIFVIHTYLSVLAKLLAYEVLTKDGFIDETELEGIINGKIFENLNVLNFITRDFYHWVSLADNFQKLKPVFRSVSSKISEYSWDRIDEDILKGVYQELIDIETRHALGEYYTPDWLCEKIVSEIDLKSDSKVLDPACGSGSFLAVTAQEFMRKFPDMSIEEILENTYGVDIHPLSVQISKTTLLLSVSEKIKKAKSPVYLNVYLANTLDVSAAHHNQTSILGNEVRIDIDNQPVMINSQFIESPDYNAFIDFCDKIAEYTTGDAPKSLQEFQKLATARLKQHLDTSYSDVFNDMYSIYKGLKAAKETNRDDIWKFILQNTVKPAILKGKFNYVVGNPPWITLSSIHNKSYQEKLENLAIKYRLDTTRANLPHLEIAAIFLSHCSSYFLASGGEIHFVMPRSMMNGGQHENTRNGSAMGLELTEIWDLQGVSPLFRIPSCVLKAKRVEGSKRVRYETLPGLAISGRVKDFNSHLADNKDRLSFEIRTWHYSILGQHSAFTKDKIYVKKAPYYKQKFVNGATIVPRSFYFIATNDPLTERDTVYVTKQSLPEEKMPWKQFENAGIISTAYIFRTAISKNVAPYYAFNLPIVVLPIKIHDNSVDLISSEELREAGEFETYEWFKKADEYWESHRTEKNSTITRNSYLDWQNKLSKQDMKKRYIVMYAASGASTNAAIIDRNEHDQPFMLDCKTYGYYTDNANEAYYIMANLNASESNATIREFQTLGLFGPRDIHRRILDVPFPKYDPGNALHREIATEAKNLALKIRGANPAIQLSNIGRIRTFIRKEYKSELDYIDGLLSKIISD